MTKLQLINDDLFDADNHSTFRTRRIPPSGFIGDMREVYTLEDLMSPTEDECPECNLPEEECECAFDEHPRPEGINQ
jgi:hypothetical protein